MDSKSTESDWSQYYSNEKFKVPPFIVNILYNKFANAFRKYLPEDSKDLKVVELGGADSCVFELFMKDFSIAEYHIVDNNKVGMDKLRRRKSEKVFAHELDLFKIESNFISKKPDVVFSAGLIEHFEKNETAICVKKHFELVRPGGLVLISFPTPTIVYKGFRKLLEKTGRFPPLFERPLMLEEIKSAVAPYGKIISSEKIWSTILTQYFVVVKAN